MISEDKPTADVRSSAKRNRLAESKSPYLQQHADNPVDWHPWGDAAFEKARRENKPVFLSIGYSTCHWCHVMAHECFEKDEVADLLNQHFIAIKVDREERPDVDQVYMDVCQAMTGSGGWPLSIFMTPDALPFYAATYIPRQGGAGRMGMLELLPLVAEKWRADPERLKSAGQEIIDALAASRAVREKGHLQNDIFRLAEQNLAEAFDDKYGGFGKPPKFPRPHDLCFLLRRYRRTENSRLLDMVTRTLTAMRRGGIYDQVGFGFHRYATDETWLVPHFEKMLYDQAGLLTAYAEAYQVTQEPLFADTAREIAVYLKRDLRSPDGAFYAAEDADSEGEEGRFYVWSETELIDLLGSDVAGRFNPAYGVTAAGNYHEEATGEATGTNILHLAVPADEVRAVLTDDQLAAARNRLLEVRARRVRPHRDEKIVTAWNAMVISALARTSRILDEPVFLEDAERVAAFLWQNLRNRQGRLLRSYNRGAADIPGFAEDYAFLARGLLDMYEAGFAAEHLLRALVVAEDMAQLFFESESGILFDTAHNAEPLVMRPHSSWDGAMPAAGSIALEVFSRLHLVTGDQAWRARAEQLLDASSGQLGRYPGGFTQMLQSAAWLLEPGREVVLAGRTGSDGFREMLKAARCSFAPETVFLHRPEPLPKELEQLAPHLASMPPGKDGPLAYICRDFACLEPTAKAEDLRSLLTVPPVD